MDDIDTVCERNRYILAYIILIYASSGCTYITHLVYLFSWYGAVRKKGCTRKTH